MPLQSKSIPFQGKRAKLFEQASKEPVWKGMLSVRTASLQSRDGTKS
ncbi:MAG: hypothetical protein WB502_08180 [Thermoactinomyces sp.]